MSKELLVSATSMETRLAILEDDQVSEIFIERTKSRGILGNIYKGRVTRVLPGMQAAFVNVGLDRDAFLYVSDVFEEIEEYEKLFEGDAAELPASPEAPAEGKRVRRRRRRRNNRRAAPPREATTAAPPPEPVGRLLPEELEMEAPPRQEEAGSESVPASRLLPERLETLVEYEPEDPAADAPEDRVVRLEDGSHRQKMAVSRNARNRKSSRPREEPALIGDLLREGQEILVQVAKEPIGRKGARITSHVALPGRHLVLMPTVNHVGVSRKIVSEQERQRLKELVLRLRGDAPGGFIIRTAGENQSESELRKDMRYLTRLWEDIRSKAERQNAPSLIHAEPGLTERVVRDYFSADFRAVRVDDEQEYERIVEFVNRFNPELVNRVRLYRKETPLLDEYGVTAEIERALKQKVWLKNGGYIVINQTEALVAIDVNTGKFVGRTNSLEDTITRTNLDAVREVVRQIRLRDLGGIIVIDFIDMDERKNRDKVMEALEEQLKRDKSPSRILQFNEFGLVAITRKRVKQSLERALCQPCSYCNGTGMTKSPRTVCYSIHREVKRVLGQLGEAEELLIRCHPDVAQALRQGERRVIEEIEEMTRRTVSLKADPLMHVEHFDLVEA